MPSPFNLQDLVAKASATKDVKPIFDSASRFDIRLAGDKTMYEYRYQPEETYTDFVLLNATKTFLTHLIEQLGLDKRYSVELFRYDLNNRLYLRIILAQ
jgi:hypothetical protein